MIILRILFSMLLIFIFAVLAIAVFLAFHLRNFTKRFKQQKESKQQSVDGNVVIDRRAPSEINKKIIPQDEGEYVEFEEE